MPREAVSLTANVERTGRHKWVKKAQLYHPIFNERLPTSMIVDQVLENIDSKVHHQYNQREAGFLLFLYSRLQAC